jgi:hypothetical protein
LKIALLPPWYDVDTLDDWQFLRGHVAAMRAAGIDPQIPRTEAIIGGFGPRTLEDSRAGVDG